MILNETENLNVIFENENPHEAALAYASIGWHVFPVHKMKNGKCSCKKECEHQGKHPKNGNGCNGATTNTMRINQWWLTDNYNIGIATGEKSGIWVLDIDPKNGGQESLEKIIEENGPLPETLTVKTGGGGTHYYFCYEDGIGSRNDLSPGLDHKGDGGYVIAPPSNHKSGGKYEWGHRAEIANAPEWLVELIKKPKQKTKRRRSRKTNNNHKPTGATDKIYQLLHKRAKDYIDAVPGQSVGNRDETAFNLSGNLRALDVFGVKLIDPDEIERYMLEWNQKNSPPLDEETIRKKVESSRTNGTPREKKPLQTGSGKNHDEEINGIVLSGDLEIDTEAAWDAIEWANDPPTLFRHGSVPARIEKDDEDRDIIRMVDFPRMCHYLARATKWAKPTRDSLKMCEPPDKVVKDVMATPDMPLPILSRIVNAPVFAADGTLQTGAGYHEASRTYYSPAPGFVVDPIPDKPTTDDIKHAKKGILDHLLVDFPFAGDAERATVVALLLLPFCRDLISGSTPLHLIEKPSPGTGATLLVNVLSLISTGYPVATMTEGTDEEEWRKRITAKLMMGAQWLVIDNLRKRMDSAAVSSAITTSFWSDRVLCKSLIVDIPVRCVWVATGNNPSLSDEITRRTIRCRLNAKIDKPHLRENFRHKNLLGWASHNRGKLVRSALVLIQSWIAAGKPPGTQKPLGMFESWSKVMGGILAHVGIDGFLANLNEFYSTSDVEGEQWRAFILGWFEKFGNEGVKTSELLLLADEIDLPIGGKTDNARKITLGKKLNCMRDRTFDLPDQAVTVREAGKSKGYKFWKLE